MTEIRDFNETDWQGLAGAAKFDDGSEPKIAYFELEGHEVWIVGDADGIEVHDYWEPKGGSQPDDIWHLGIQAPAWVVAAAMRHVVENVRTIPQLLKLGFQEI